MPKHPKSARCSILTTTRQPAELIDWADKKIRLPHFEPELGGDFLLSLVHNSGIQIDDTRVKQYAQEISRQVGGLPLLLSSAAGYLNISQCSLENFLTVFEQSVNVWAGSHEGANWMYERTIDTMFDMALSKLTFDAKQLVNILAFMNPEGVPEDMLQTERSKAYIKALEEPNQQGYVFLMPLRATL